MNWLKNIQVSAIYTEYEFIVNVLASIAVLALAALVRRWYINALPESISLEDRRRRLIMLRNRLTVVVAIILISLWATELKTLAVSLLAIAVALVVATKEVILSMIGGMLRSATKRFSINDRIEIKGIRGDVVDVTLMYTVVMELGPGTRTNQYTGKTVAIPNSLLLTESVSVDAVTRDHTMHNLEVPVTCGKGHADVEQAITTLQSVAEEVCAPYMAHAEQQLTQWERDTALNLLSSRPRVVVHPDERGEWWLTLRFVAPIKERVRIEQSILREYIKRMARPQ